MAGPTWPRAADGTWKNAQAAITAAEEMLFGLGRDNTMSAYVIAGIEVTDPEDYQTYASQTVGACGKNSVVVSW